MKALVSGAQGMMNTDLCRELAQQGHTVGITNIQEMNAHDPARVQQVFQEFQPSVFDGSKCEPDNEFDIPNPLPAPRPHMGAGRSLQVELMDLANWMRPWPEALREYITGTLLKMETA